MTQEDKDLIFRDLCGRLPYVVKISVQSWDGEEQGFVDKVDVLYSVNKDEYIKSANEDYDFNIEYIKPYLLPLSSMTEEQKKEWQSLMVKDAYGILYHTIESYNYLNKHHFDYRGLIPLGLANDSLGLNIY